MAASWPGAVKNFSTVINGVTKLVAALFNSAYDEITAVQTNLSGSVVQVVNYQTGAVASGSTAIPWDDTIPQITEGDEYMTLAITPKSATNKLKIEVVGTFGTGSGDFVTMALFQDATANALACNLEYSGSAGSMINIKFTHFMTSGTTSATTFRVRAGADGGGVTFNGISAARKAGGVLISSITITEIRA